MTVYEVRAYCRLALARERFDRDCRYEFSERAIYLPYLAININLFVNLAINVIFRFNSS